MKKKFTILLMALAIISIASVSAGVFLTHVENVTVDVVNVTDGEPFRDKCTNLTGGDAIICFNEYRTNVQYSQGVHIDHWYVGNGSEDIYPHSTKLIKAELFYKSADGKEMSKVQNATDGFIDAFPLIDGYWAYKAIVWYEK
jgi:hypothetical protein